MCAGAGCGWGGRRLPPRRTRGHGLGRQRRVITPLVALRAVTGSSAPPNRSHS
jgi:hypothetical protein